MKRSITTVGFAATLILALAACGPKKASLTVSLTDFQFAPANAEVAAGADVTLTLTNSSSVVHQWVVMKLGTRYTTPFDADDEANAYFKAEVQPGESQSFEFTAPSDPGDYQIVCGVPGHAEAGMLGTLTVR
jgi:uncharacterized cupredoxin-like copper-binding protein